MSIYDCDCGCSDEHPQSNAVACLEAHRKKRQKLSLIPLVFDASNPLDAGFLDWLSEQQTPDETIEMTAHRILKETFRKSVIKRYKNGQ